MLRILLIALLCFPLMINGQELSTSAKLMSVYSLVGSEQYEEALKELNEVIIQDPNISNAYIFKGLCLKNLKRYSEALEALDKASEMEPQNADVRYLKGETYLDSGNIDLAKKAFEDCLYYDNNYYKAYTALAKIDRKNQDFDEAEKKLMVVLRNQRFNLESRRELASLYLEKEDTVNALKVVQELLGIQANDKIGLELRMGLYYQMEVFDSLLKDIDVYLNNFEGNEELFFRKGIANLQLGDTISALRDFNDVIYSNEERAEAYFYRAIIRNALFDKLGACKDIRVSKDKGFKPDEELMQVLCTE